MVSEIELDDSLLPNVNIEKRLLQSENDADAERLKKYSS